MPGSSKRSTLPCDAMGEPAPSASGVEPLRAGAAAYSGRRAKIADVGSCRPCRRCAPRPARPAAPSRAPSCRPLRRRAARRARRPARRVPPRVGDRDRASLAVELDGDRNPGLVEQERHAAGERRDAGRPPKRRSCRRPRGRRRRDLAAEQLERLAGRRGATTRTRPRGCLRRARMRPVDRSRRRSPRCCVVAVVAQVRLAEHARASARGSPRRCGAPWPPPRCRR